MKHGQQNIKLPNMYKYIHVRLSNTLACMHGVSMASEGTAMGTLRLYI